ncbi:SKP1-like protein 1A [Fagus crenata]
MSNMNETPSSSSFKIAIKTGDNKVFEIDEAIAMQMTTVKNLSEVIDSSASIILPNVKSAALANLINYCNKKVEFNNQEKVMKAYGDELLKKLTLVEVMDTILAANFLSFEEALDFFSQAVADHIMFKSPSYVRKYFAVPNDSEELKDLRKKNDWAFNNVEED